MPAAGNVSSAHAPAFGLLAVLGNRRAAYFHAATHNADLPEPAVLDWAELVADPERLRSLQHCDLVRVDAAGEDPRVTQRFIELGDYEGPSVEASEFRATDAVFRGMTKLFGQIEDTPRWTVSPASILAMCDKWETHKRLLPLPIQRPPTELLTTEMVERHTVSSLLPSLGLGDRLFVKPRYGSSASGVCALWRHANGYRLIGPIEIGEYDTQLGRPRLHNTLRIRQYTDPADVELILHAVVATDSVVEAWLPKASLAARGFDLRIVVIGGHARHVVIRMSRHPMTNLHLGSDRGDLEAFRRRYGDAPLEAAKRTAEQAASAFPDALVLGVDVLLNKELTPYVLEVNAFGDLLPRVTSQGQSTYEAVVEAMIDHVGSTRELARAT